MRLNGQATRIVPACLAVAVVLGAAVWLNRPVQLPRVDNTLRASTPAKAPADATPAGTLPPDVNPAAFKDRGDLAFVREGLLYNLDGATGQVRQLTESGQASSPAWSADGQWLAFVRVTDAQAGTGPLWLVRRDGTQAHQVQGLAGPVTEGQFSWLPTSDVLAVGQENGLWLAPTQGNPTKAASGLRSPDGKYLAYGTTLPSTDPAKRTDALYTVAVDGGKAVQRLVAPAGDGIELVAWWPDGKGLLYRLDPDHSASLAADGLGLWSLRLSETTPKSLATGLTYGSWLSFSPQGRLVMVKGNGRIAWANKQLAVFDVAAGSGESLPNPAGKVALDPAFSPDGRRIAFVAAKDLGDKVWGLGSDSQLVAWVATRTLWIENADGSGAHPLSAGPGVYQPAWSRDGKSILYVRDNALWIIGAAGGTPQRVVGLSGGSKDLFGFYGFVHYDGYAWYQP